MCLVVVAAFHCCITIWWTRAVIICENTLLATKGGCICTPPSPPPKSATAYTLGMHCHSAKICCPRFQKFVNALDPRYALSQLGSVQYCGLKIWSSHQGSGYISVTENSMALKSAVSATTNLIHCCKHCRGAQMYHWWVDKMVAAGTEMLQMLLQLCDWMAGST